MSRADGKGGGRDATTAPFGQFGILLKALAAALLLTGLKVLVHRSGWEFIETLPLLTALMGGVVFTLAILLAGVLADYKESERIVGELSSQLRRLYWDAPLVIKGPLLPRFRGHLLELTREVNANLRGGRSMRLRSINQHIEALDRTLVDAVQVVGPTSPVRTIQVGLGNLVRLVDRLENIIETTFIRAGYYYAGTVVGVAVVGLTFTQLRPVEQGFFLYGFACFLLVGLYVLISDLDNPFGGHVRISMRQLEKFEETLSGLVAAQAAPEGRPPLPP